MKDKIEFATLFGEVFIDSSILLPCGKISSCWHVREIEFQFKYSGTFSGLYCYLVKFQSVCFDEATIKKVREELHALAQKVQEPELETA